MEGEKKPFAPTPPLTPPTSFAALRWGGWSVRLRELQCQVIVGAKEI